MNFLVDNLFLIFAGMLAVAMAIFVFRLRGARDPYVKLGLHDFVSLDAAGWWVIAAFGIVGAAVMIFTSAAIGVDYWVGLAIKGDMASERIEENAVGFWSYFTVGTVSFFVLALIFEFFSDLGVPLASGLAQRKKPLLPRLAIAATAGCIIMSLVTKWGYYDDKRDFREVQVQKQVFVDTEWHNQKERAEADILLYSDAPSLASADAKETSANRKIDSLKPRIEALQETIDNTPDSHSTNRLRLQTELNRLTDQTLAAEGEIAEAAAMRDDANKLSAAQADLAEANEKIEALIGTANEDGSTKRAAGDTIFARSLRVGLHQFLCWLFPLIWFEGRAGYIEQKRKEDANKKRRATNEEKKNTVDAEFQEVTPSEPREIEVGQEYFDELRERDQREIDRLQEMREDAKADDENLREERMTEADRSVDPGYEKGGGVKDD